MTTSSRPRYAFGDVVYVPIGFTNQAGAKPRPAVIVSDDTYNRRTPDVIIASITSNLREIPPDDYLLADWRAAGLKAPSLLQAKLMTVAQPVIRRRIGQLSARDLATFDSGLRKSLGL
jgi:mRNA interferase MazF